MFTHSGHNREDIFIGEQPLHHLFWGIGAPADVKGLRFPNETL